VTALKMMPMAEGVFIPFFSKYIDANDAFTPEETQNAAAQTMLKELLRWTKAMAVLRQA
jgi:hypothetical protein